MKRGVRPNKVLLDLLGLSLCTVTYSLLAQGAPDEATAHFTFLSDLVQFQNLAADGGLNLTMLNTGTFNIYFNPNPSGTWNDPRSFSQGT